MAEDEFNLENRVLCSDGACIGLVGADGKCKVCGVPYEGTLPASTSATDGIAPLAATEAEGEESEDTDDTAVQADASPPRSLVDDDQAERVCCSDEMCVGIIGDDGKCGTCGKAHDSGNG